MKRAIRRAAIALLLAVAPTAWAGHPVDTEDPRAGRPGTLELSGDVAPVDADFWITKRVLNVGLLPKLGTSVVWVRLAQVSAVTGAR